MRKLIKHISCGEYEFDVAINRDISVKCFEEFADFFEQFFNEEKNKKMQKEIGEVENTDDDILTLLKEKKLNKYFSVYDNIEKVVAFALPLMLKEADCDLRSEDILNYFEENGVSQEASIELFNFIVEGFTQRGQRKPKVAFSMK